MRAYVSALIIFLAMASMDAPVVRFKQRNNFAKLGITLYPEYVEYSTSGMPGNNTGFNVKYGLLPNEFYYRTFRQKDMYVTFPLILMAALTLFELAMDKRGDVFLLLGVMLTCSIVFCAIGYGLRRLFKREYTVLTTQLGNLMVVKDRQHDQIVKELQVRRATALKRSAVINRSQPPWVEVKRFKWLMEEGIISADEFAAYRELILSSVDAETEKRVASPALH